MKDFFIFAFIHGQNLIKYKFNQYLFNSQPQYSIPLNRIPIFSPCIRKHGEIKLIYEIILIIIQHQQQMTTRKGHRRTQSANIITYTNDEVNSSLQSMMEKQNKNEIFKLLNISEANIKQKICNVETLHTPVKTQDDPLFNFGKGFHKVNPVQRQKNRTSQYLVSIPQKAKNNPSKTKKSVQTQESKSKTRVINQSILKIRNKQIQKQSKDLRKTTQFIDEVNKLIKSKVGKVPEAKVRKLSCYEGEPKPVIKTTTKHKKLISNLK